VSPEVRTLILASLSPETLRAYAGDCQRFHNHLLGQGVSLSALTPEAICEWIAHEHESGYRYSSISRSLSALKTFFPASARAMDHSMVRAALRGVRKQQVELGRITIRARPISPDELERMCAVWPRTSTRGLRNRALLRLGWLCAARISEICNLRMADLDWTPEGLAVLIRRSKTDQNGEGELIGIPQCEWLTEVKAWFDRAYFLQKNFNPPLFARFRRGPDQFQASIIERPRLSVRGVRDMMEFTSKRAGIVGVSPHSLRAGMITFAASIGVPERLIAAHSRHASIRVLRGYIHRGSIWQDNALDLVVRRLPAPGEGELLPDELPPGELSALLENDPTESLRQFQKPSYGDLLDVVALPTAEPLRSEPEDQ
jgi:integrase